MENRVFKPKIISSKTEISERPPEKREVRVSNEMRGTMDEIEIAHLLGEKVSEKYYPDGGMHKT